MTTLQQNVDLDAWFANTLGGAGNGNGNKMTVGLGTSSWAWINRFGIRIPRGSFFDDVPSADSISAFDILLHASSGNTGIGSAVKFWLKRATAAFTAFTVVAGQNGVPSGADISQYVVSAGPSTGEYPGPATDATNQASYEGSPSSGDWVRVHALALGQWWFAHPEVTNLYLVAVAKDETLTSQRCTFNTSDSGSKPYAEMTYGANTPPDQPSQMSVSYGSDGQSFTLTGHYFDQDGDTSTKYEAVFEPN